MRSKTGAIAQLAIEVVVGPEFLAGSTRLKAGTAQNLVLTMLSTLTMIKLGKTYGNVMVDLQVTNEKLRARAERTIMSITGVSAKEASAALDRSAGSPKEAIFAERHPERAVQFGRAEQRWCRVTTTTTLSGSGIPELPGAGTQLRSRLVSRR